MDIGKAIDEFLKNEELSESSKPIYENVLRVFGGYFIEYNCDLSTITYNDIFKSLDYYIDERSIKFENTARFFVTAIKNFIVYCISELGIKNKDLASIFGIGNNSGGFEEKVDKKINSLIINKILKKEKSGIELDSNELKILVNECDKIIDKFKKDDLRANITNGKYIKYIGALGLEIIAYTGVKVGLITNIKLNALESGSDFIIICNNKNDEKKFKVEISRKLYLQLKNYIEIRTELIKYKNCEKDIDNLFIDYNTIPLNELRKNEPFNNLAFELVGKDKEMGSSTARISKRAIIDMICAGMSLKIIEDLTGYGNVVIQYCKEKADEIKREEKNPNQYVNDKISKRNKENKYYDIFL